MDYIVYEQPLCEHIRICLRLEQVFDSIESLSHYSSYYLTKALITNIVDLLIITDRSDLKAKLAKALTRLSNRLTPLKNEEHVDQQVLRPLIAELNRLLDYVINLTGKVAQPLRDNELLNELKQYHFTVGGPTCMDSPAYHYWLQQPVENQQADIQSWLKEFQPLKTMVTHILKLTRESKMPIEKIAHNGFYFESLDPKNDFRLIRIAVPDDIEAYPEISVGPHRVNIRWYTPKTDRRSTPIEYDLYFKLTCCN